MTVCLYARVCVFLVFSDDNNVEESINVHEEYHMALRTKSYAEFFTKAQNLLTQKPSFYDNHIKFSEILLEPSQETIPSIINNSSILSKKSKLKNLMLSFFDNTASASHFCTRILKNIDQVHYNHRFIQRALDIVNQHEQHHEKEEEEKSSSNFHLVSFELFQSFMQSKNPFSYPEILDFKSSNYINSLVLQNLKTMRNKVMRKIKYMKYTKKASKVCDQLDLAAKGTYILSRDFDTMSRLVARLHNEIERNREMIRFWIERKEDKKLGLEILKELRKSEVGFRKHVEELEEHVYLCLVTINRARALVATEIK